jgi:hypothetical protein
MSNTRDCEGTEEFTEMDLLGKSIEEAGRFVERSGYVIRMTRKNGQPLIITRDYRTNRINVAVIDGKIVEVLSVG